MSLFISVRNFSVTCSLFVAMGVHAATEVGVVGLFPGKAVLVINNDRPRTLAVGEPAVAGVRVLAVEPGQARLEVDGRPRTVGIGQRVFTTSRGESVTLRADARGHFITPGGVNGTVVRFLVDTGASYVSIGAADAARAGIDLRHAREAYSNTANGMARVRLVRLNEVRVGAVVLNDVEAVVHDRNLPLVLLGMSFLKHLDMQRNGEIMTLKKSF